MNEEQQTRFCLDELGARILHVSDSNLPMRFESKWVEKCPGDFSSVILIKESFYEICTRIPR